MRHEALDWPAFLAERATVLETWPTGKGLTLEDGVAYQSRIPKEKNFAWTMQKAREAKKTLTQPRAGVALIDQHIQLLRFLESEGGADCLPTTIDAYTRQNRYEEAARGIEKSSPRAIPCSTAFRP